MTAAAYYARGCESLACGNYLDAHAALSRACVLEPQNIVYTAAREQLLARTRFFFGRAKEKHGEQAVDSTESRTEKCCSCCAEGGCECCAEGGCECCAELCATICCETACEGLSGC